MKKHRVNRIMTFILVLALSVSTLLIGCGKNYDKIVLGWIGPLTGENTIWGTAEMQALTMAVEDTNAAGGLLGKEVELKTYDNRGDAVETTNAAKKAIQQDGCIALFGCNTSACAIALSEVCTQFNIIDHHMDVIMDVCDKITVINFGTQIATGAPESIQSNPDVIAAYLGGE